MSAPIFIQIKKLYKNENDHKQMPSHLPYGNTLSFPRYKKRLQLGDPNPNSC